MDFDLASDGRDYVAVWQDDRNYATTKYDIYGAVLPGSGAAANPGFPICNAPENQLKPRITFGNGRYLVAWEDERQFATSRQDVYGAFVMPGGTLAGDTQGFAINTGVNSNSVPVVGYVGGDDRRFVVVNEKLPADGPRAVGNFIKACAQVPDGCVGWWPGDTNANDLSGPGNNGTFLPATAVKYEAGLVGQAFSFTAASKTYVNIPDNGTLDIVGPLSIEAWVKPNNGSTAMILSKADAKTAGGASYWLGITNKSDGPHLHFAVYAAAPTSPKNAPQPRRTLTSVLPVVTADKFQHVAATFDPASQTMKLYTDGVEVQQTTLNDGSATVSAIANSAQPLWLGAWKNAAGLPADFFDGLIDEAAIYNRVLTAAEIAEIHKSGADGKCRGVLKIDPPTPPSGTSGSPAGGSGRWELTWRSVPGLTYRVEYKDNLSDPVWRAAGADVYATRLLTSFTDWSATNGQRFYRVEQLSDRLAGECPLMPPYASNWWPGDSNALDRVGGQDGSPGLGMSYSTGMVNQAFSFSGPMYPFINFGTNAGNFDTNDFTIEFWVATSFGGTAQALLSKRTSCVEGLYWEVRLDQGRVLVEFDNALGGGPALSLRGSRAVNDGTFHHVAIVRLGTAVAIFVDGELDASATALALVNLSNLATLVAGHSPCSSVADFNGRLDELAFYGRALSGDEIRGLCRAGSAGKCAAAPVASCLRVPPGCVGLWPGDGNTKDSSGNGNDGGWFVNFAPGMVGPAFRMDGSNYVQVHAFSDSLLCTNQCSVEAWIRPDDLSNEMKIFSRVSSAGQRSYELSAFFDRLQMIISADGTNYDAVVSPAGILATGGWTHVAGTFNAGRLTLYVNGAAVASKDSSITSLYPGGWSIQFPNVSPRVILGGSWQGTQRFRGLLDEVAAYHRQLSAIEVAESYSAMGYGTCRPPAILQHPQYVTVSPGAPASFSVSATGSSPLSYQWQLNGLAIPDATNATYAWSNTQFSQDGNYTVVVTNHFGAVTSRVAMLVVLGKPLVITAHNTNRLYGALNPPLTGTVTGLRSLDSRQLWITFATPATPASSPGTYPITPVITVPSNTNPDPSGILSTYTVTTNVGTLTVAGCAAPTFGPTNLPVGIAGQPYYAALAGSGGTPPYSFQLYPDWWVQGLMLSSSGVLSGTPVNDGVFASELLVTDAAGCGRLLTCTWPVFPNGTWVSSTEPGNLPVPPVGTGGSGNTNQDTTTSSIEVFGLSTGAVQCITVRLWLEHERDGDLLLTLTTPSSNQVVLANHRGGDGSNFMHTIFQNYAPESVSNGVAPFTGEFRPETLLTTTNPNGEWKLQIQDTVNGHTGTLRHWAITFCSPPAYPDSGAWIWETSPANSLAVATDSQLQPGPQCVAPCLREAPRTYLKTYMNVCAFQTSDGTALWGTDIGGELAGAGRIVVAGRLDALDTPQDRLIVVMENGTLYGLNPHNEGGLSWVRDIRLPSCSGERIEAAPVALLPSLAGGWLQTNPSPGLVFVVTTPGCLGGPNPYGRVLALEPEWGTEAWMRDNMPLGAGTGLALDYGRNLLVAMFTQESYQSWPTVLALDALTGGFRWAQENVGAVHARPLLANDAVYVVTTDENLHLKLYKLDAGTGEVVWSVPLSQADVHHTRDLAYDPLRHRVIVAGDDGTLHSVEDLGASAVVPWSKPSYVFDYGLSSAPVMAPAFDKLYVGATNGLIYQLNPDDGTTEAVGRLDVDEPVLELLAETDDGGSAACRLVVRTANRLVRASIPWRVGADINSAGSPYGQVILSAQAPTDPINVGQPFTVTFTVQGGAWPPGYVTLWDTLPEGLSIVSASVSQGTFSINGREFTAELGPAWGSTTISLVLTGAVAGTFTHIAELGGFFRDPDLSDNSVRLTHQIVAPPAPAPEPSPTPRQAP